MFGLIPGAIASQRKGIHVELAQIRACSSSGVEEHGPTGFGAGKTIAMDSCVVIFADDLHRRRRGIDNQQATTAERDEPQSAGRVNDWDYWCVIGPQFRILTCGAARSDCMWPDSG